jgi:hypothetical protein
MAEQIISPGVFTRENDLSFLPQGIGQIGAAVVGPTTKGPAFIPTVVRSFSDFERRFGGLSNDTYIPQTVREYLRYAGSVTVVRVLAGGGYTFSTSPNIQPLGVIAGAGPAVAAFHASGAMAIAANTLDAEDEVQITVNGTEYRFIAADPEGGIPASQSPIFYFSTGSSIAAALNFLTGSINNAAIGVTTASSSLGLEVSSSTAGKAGNSITVQTGSGGTILSNVLTLTGGSDASVGSGILLGLIYPSKSSVGTPSLNNSSISAGTVISSSFGIVLDDSGANVTSTAFSASLNPQGGDDGNPYLFKYIGYTADNSKTSSTAFTGTPGYTHLNFKSVQTSILATGSLGGYPNGLGTGSVVTLANMSSTDQVFDGIGKTEGYGYASTPYIQSQLAQGNKDLFKFHTLDHGTKCNRDYKVSIANLKEPGDIDGVEQYSQFSVIIRKATDTDATPLILEQFNNITLDPNSPRYISRVIGDRYPEYNETLNKVEIKGNYPNISNYLRVEVSTPVEERATSPKLSPKGFKAVLNPFNTASLNVNCIFPSASYEGIQQTGTDGTYNSKGYLGFKFADKESDSNNFLNPLPNSAESNIAGNFNVERYSGHASSGLWTGSLSASIDITGATGPSAGQLKFTVPFQGGEDGIAPWTIRKIGDQIANNNLYGFDFSSATATGHTAYKKALDIIANQDEYDINMLAMPGIIYSIHSTTANSGIDMCEERGDCFFIMDLDEQDATVNTAISNVSGLDTSFAATYFPWVKVQGATRDVFVPPSVIVPGAIAQSDKIGAEWFAPAGLNRGILGTVKQARMGLTQAERDRLYDNKINPIATFPRTGVCIWGQKTLQERSTALDRINVRRLLIAVKKFIASSSKYLVFEQNTTETRRRFLNIVNPYLESIQQRQGLYSFKVQMDENNNTPTVIDRNQLVGAIYLQPTKTAEFIVLDFNILPTGATFDGVGGAGGTGGY